MQNLSASEAEQALQGIRAEMMRRGLLAKSVPTFRGANLAVQSYRGPEFMLAGPSETGKTWATLWLLDSLLRETSKAQAGLLRKIAADIGPTVLVTYKRVIERSGSGATAFGGEKPEWYDYPNGARLYIGGMDRPGKTLSGERDFVYVNQAEELTLNDWEFLSTRTTGRGAVTDTALLFGDCNPGPEDHWILKRDLLKVFYSTHRDNPSLFNEDGTLTSQGVRTMTKLDALTGIRRARLRDGKWVGAEGLFFEEWDEELHTCEPFDIPGDWPVWGALDEGFAHPLAFGLLTEDNDGMIYLIGEHVRHGWLPPAHCKAIRRLAERCGVSWDRVKKIAAGHDVFQVRGDREGKTRQQQYIEAVDPETDEPIGIGKKFVKATLDRRTGAQELLSRLGNREAGIRPRLKIFNTCKRTIATITRMVHDPSDPEDVLKVDAVNGEGGDDCFIAGTMVTTAKGQMPIEQILPGDMALTRGGWQPVKAAWRSRVNATVLRATFSDGTTVTGTPNHRFYVASKGWISLDALRYGDILMPLWQIAGSSLNPSSLTASLSAGTQTQSVPSIESITRRMAIGLKGVFGRSMLRFGSLFTERFLRDTISTTLTKILSTTTLEISPASQNLSTPESTSKVPRDWLRRVSISSESGRSLLLGTAPMKDGSGIARTRDGHGNLASLLSELASNAVADLKALPCATTTDFALTPASLNGAAAPALTMSRSRASNAERTSPQTNTTSYGSARGSAAALRLVDLVEAGQANTYSLHIHRHHEYIANGVLVKNCYDMLRYGVMVKKAGKGVFV